VTSRQERTRSGRGGGDVGVREWLRKQFWLGSVGPSLLERQLGAGGFHEVSMIAG